MKKYFWPSASSVAMDNGRQRAHSASSLKSLSLYAPGQKWSNRQARSTPELRLYMQQSMLSGLNTTVPQSLVPQDFNSCHKPRKKCRHDRQSCRGFCHECCTLKLFLVILQLLVGATISGAAFYLYFFSTKSLKIRETSFWAGIPLFLAGVLGIYHCANDYENYIGSTKHFILKAACFLLSLVCIFICLVASTFPVIHIARLYTFKHCENQANDCLCYESHDQSSRQFTYKELGNCDLLFCVIKILLIVESSACILGSIISFWYVILLWRSKYGGIYSGIRYSSTSNGHVQRGVV
ncbi:uncharacterized protein LOC132555301 [Ylistrum balloti]|uniref:uncharacterized protein LOC132555301 n=1 Tax=Ylistrum balloti TaxID=509963 RepID=UPI0029059E74|nr:uncharacterized protein LOC132555301 [Ylistrum balloti]